MANHQSAIKQHRQDLKRRANNRLQRARVRTAIKGCRQAIDAGGNRTLLDANGDITEIFSWRMSASSSPTIL